MTVINMSIVYSNRRGSNSDQPPSYISAINPEFGGGSSSSERSLALSPSAPPHEDVIQSGGVRMTFLLQLNFTFFHLEPET